MKRIVVLLIALTYFTATSGVMVNIHYCMGRMAGVNYGHDEDRDCRKCGMPQQDGCCKTEHKFVKSSADHIGAKAFTGINQMVAINENYGPVFDLFPPSREPLSTPCNSPPDPRRNQLRVYTGVFRI